jgi:hypothetical protein
MADPWSWGGKAAMASATCGGQSYIRAIIDSALRQPAWGPARDDSDQLYTLGSFAVLRGLMLPAIFLGGGSGPATQR